MNPIFKHTPLYRFLEYCINVNEVTGEQNILDCGAGGETPPLSLLISIIHIL